jgi:hypothetical protein
MPEKSGRAVAPGATTKLVALGAACWPITLWLSIGTTTTKVANRSKWRFAFMSTSRVWLAHGSRASKAAYPCSPPPYTIIAPSAHC